MNIEQLVSAVIAHALRQHEDSEWDIVVDGMRRDEIASLIRDAKATTKNQAVRAVQAKLDTLVRIPVFV
jgi:hypothetical protein